MTNSDNEVQTSKETRNKKLKHYKTHENSSKMKDFEVNFITKTTNVYKPLTFDINTVSTYVNSFC